MAALLVNISGARASWCTPGGTPACNLSGGTPPVITPALGGAFAAMSSGLFEYVKTDLTLPGPMPIEITRTYRSEDRNTSNNFINRTFGLGTTLNYDIFLYSNSEVAGGTYVDAELVMPDGSELKCQNQSSNTSNYTQADFLCASQPSGIWFGSTMVWNSSTSQWNLTRKDKTVYAFGQGAPLQSITDRYGNSVTITRKTNLSPTCTNPGTLVQSSNGRYVDLCFDANNYPNNVSKAIDNSGREVDYIYNSPTTLLTVNYKSYRESSDPASFTFGSDGDIETITTDVNSAINATNVVTAEYDSSNRLKQLNAGGSVQYSYTGSPISSVTMTFDTGIGGPGNGSQRQLSFDGNGYLISDTRAHGSSLAETTTYSRDPLTELVCSITDPLNRLASFLYDSQSTCADAPKTFANLTSLTLSNLVNPSQPVNWSYTYDPNYSELTSVTDPLNHTTTITINPANGKATSVTDALGRTWYLEYNYRGQITWIGDPVVNGVQSTLQFAYTDGNNGSWYDLLSITDSLGNVTTFTPDSLGRVTSVTTPLRETTSYTYDALDHVTTRTDPNGNVTTYKYEDDGRPTAIIDARGNQTTFNWTSGWAVKECDPRSHCYSWSIDALSGLPTTATDKNGFETEYTYDALQRLSSVVFNASAGASKQTSIAYTYDAGDRLLQDADTGGGNPSSSGNTRSFTWDGLDNLLTETYNAPEGYSPCGLESVRSGEQTYLDAGVRAGDCKLWI